MLRPGEVSAGDAVGLIRRPHPDWPLERLAALIRQRVCQPALLHAVLALPLAPSWRRLFEQRLARGQAEDWAPRLDGGSGG